jgi:hypothetical protein
VIVPQYWAEAQLQQRDKGKQVTVRRFGWSDASLDDAQANADARVKEAFARVLAGEKLPRRDPKIPYNGAAGLPIREEIVSRHGDIVVTRNSYGARCLNTPNVFFADIDFPEGPAFRFTLGVFAALVAVAIAMGVLTGSRALGIGLGFAALIGSSTVSAMLHRLRQSISGGPEKIARGRIAQFLVSHPDWNLRLYRTPAGMRVMATHQTFSPTDPSVTECFDALKTDPLYATMCRNQQCFRARISAKPWRIGISGHMRPRPGVWPVAPDRIAQRSLWIAEYELAASVYAACEFIESVGSGKIHPDVRPVLELHDDSCSVGNGLPLA